MANKFYQLLLHSFDSKLSDTHQKQLDNAVETSEELQRLKNEHVKMRTSIMSFQQTSFSPFFAERVLSRIQQQKESIVDLFRLVFRPVAVAALLLIIIFTSYNIGRANSFTLVAALGIQKPSLEQKLALEVPFE